MKKLYQYVAAVTMMATAFGTPLAYAATSFDRDSLIRYNGGSFDSTQNNFTGQFSARANITGLIDFELFNQNGIRVAQRSFDNQQFNAGESKSFVFPTPSNLSAGTYTLDVGIFRQNWSELLFWDDNAGTITIGSQTIADTNPTAIGTTTPQSNDEEDEAATSTTPLLPNTGGATSTNSTTVATTANTTNASSTPTASSNSGTTTEAVADGIVVLESNQTANSITTAQTNSIRVTFTGRGTAHNALLDLELYDDSGRKISQWFWNNITLGNNETVDRTLTSGALSVGNYHWSAGIFGLDWVPLQKWYDRLASFTVTNATETTSTTPLVPTTGGATSTGPSLPSNQGAEHNGNLMVTTVVIPEQITMGTASDITVKMISAGGENANNLTTHLMLINDSGETALDVLFPNLDVLHESPRSFIMSTGTALATGSYRLRAVSFNQSGTLNAEFANLGTVIVK